jgi:FkbM family methyltransferase
MDSRKAKILGEIMGPPGSQLKIAENGQDFFVLGQTAYKERGFFVDIGAADGITGSNTFILEKFYKWHGICVDPNPAFMQSLFNCRDSYVSTLCVYSETGKILPFKFCTDENQFFGWNFRSGIESHLSSIDETVDKSFSTINVLTISLNDLLELYNAPKDIDYISLDTEGSEYEILKSFDFEKYNVRCLTVEHAFTENRNLIYDLLTAKGYSRVQEEYSGQEDWYIKS